MNCKITWASPKMDRQLKTIWKDCFNDSDEYIDFFFYNRFVPQNTVVAVCEEQVLGVAYLLPAGIIWNNGEIPAMYGYAIGVSPKYRGRGICKKIHDFIYRYCDENNCVYLLHPANERLAAYYKSIGLAESGYIKKFICSFDGTLEGEDISLTDINGGEYAKLRNAFFMGEGYIKWDGQAIDYALSENAFCGGFCKKLIYKSNEYALFGKVENNKLDITEATIPDSLLPELAQRLAVYFHVFEVTLCLPSRSDADGVVLLCAMGYKTEILQKGYLNLFLN